MFTLSQPNQECDPNFGTLFCSMFNCDAVKVFETRAVETKPLFPLGATKNEKHDPSFVKEMLQKVRQDPQYAKKMKRERDPLVHERRLPVGRVRAQDDRAPSPIRVNGCIQPYYEMMLELQEPILRCIFRNMITNMQWSYSNNHRMAQMIQCICCGVAPNLLKGSADCAILQQMVDVSNEILALPNAFCGFGRVPIGIFIQDSDETNVIEYYDPLGPLSIILDYELTFYNSFYLVPFVIKFNQSDQDLLAQVQEAVDVMRFEEKAFYPIFFTPFRGKRQ